jgi:dipeptidyl aminopeptidase/acylaminoacyl peptidase
MNLRDHLETELTAWFNESAAPQTADFLDDVLWQTAHSSQRPRWTFLERWIPMDITMSRVQAPTGARYVALLVILILITAIAVALAGAQRRIPTPYGPAINGVIAFTTATGDIVTGDTLTGAITLIVGGPELDSSPMFSPDGTRIAFVRQVEDMVRVFAVDATGGEPTELTTAALARAEWLRWSPDGTLLAWLSGGSPWIAKTDGSDAHPLDVGMIVRDEISWRPPNGSELLIRGLSIDEAAFGLFLVNVDGSDLRAVTPVDGGGKDYLWVTWSPDGTRLAYSSWPYDTESSAHVLTIDGLRDAIIKPDDGSRLLSPAWSPDGTRIAFTVEGKGIGVAPADDETPHITLTGPSFLGLLDFAWSPDGKVILAIPQGTGEPWLIDPNGGPGTRVSWSYTDFPRNRASWSNWQRLAP